MKRHFVIALTIILVSIYACKDSSELNVNTTPTATFTFSPINIDTSTVVTFNATGSSDIEDAQALLRYSWDFEGNMEWTEAAINPIMSHKFTKSGAYKVGLKVIDTQGWSGETNSTVIVHDSI